MKKTVFTLAALILALSLVFTGCGAKNDGKVPALKAGEALELTSWSMNATAWSSPNGATVNLTAIPNGYAEGQSVLFCVRLEGEDVASVPCQWDGKAYTASADLNAADGYCYYAILTGADGSVSEVPVNTPTAVIDNSLINMETALNAYCEVSVTDSKLEGDTLTVVDGTMKVQLPWLTLDVGPVTCESAVLVLSYNNEDVAKQELTMPETDGNGLCTVDLSGITYTVPNNLEDDHQLSIRLDVALTDGRTMTAPGGTWYYLDGQLLLAVG